jgi:hypothetical protein
LSHDVKWANQRMAHGSGRSMFVVSPQVHRIGAPSLTAALEVGCHDYGNWDLPWKKRRCPRRPVVPNRVCFELSRPRLLLLNAGVMSQAHLPVWLPTRRKLIKFAAIIAVGIWTTGCLPIPRRYTSGPGAKGRVVDATSHQRIHGAFVTLTRPQGSPAQTKTSRDGHFRIPNQDRWYVYDALRPHKLVYLPGPAILTIDHEGYRVYVTNTQPGVDLIDTGIINLKTLAP